MQDFEAGYPARVIDVHRGGMSVLSSRGATVLPLPPGEAPAPVVGDWLLLEMDAPHVLCRIEPHSALAGSAANLDSLFVVDSCGDDLDLPRLERYLALAFAAGVEPVIVLTRADLCAQIPSCIRSVQAVAPGVACIAVDATTASTTKPLQAWLDSGQTVAFVGAPGVGKSSLIDTLAGDAPRHAGMFQLSGGAWVIDTPELRELRADEVDTDLQALDIEPA
ncbi:MAG: GTPase RsgA [Rhodanobacter lindaniclasticus]